MRVAGVQTRWAIAIALAVALILTVVGFAIFRGLGPPTVPEGDVAIVEGVDPEDVSREDFDAALAQTAARVGQPIPSEDDEQFPQFREQAMNDVLVERWILGEGQDEGIEISDRELDQQLEQIKEQSFANEREFEQFKEDNNLTDEDVRDRVRLQALNQRFQERFVNREPPVSRSEARAYFDQNQAQYSRPETRTVRLILNEDEAEVEAARAELEADDSNSVWRRVAREFSQDQSTRTRGGRLEGATEGQGDPGFDAEVFAAAEGELVGPFETDSGFYLIQVQEVDPGQEPAFSQVEDDVVRQIVAIRQQTDFAEFQIDFVEKWRSRTTCAPGFITDNCDNSGAPPPQEGAPPVVSRPAIEPGTAGLVAVPAQGLPQGPIVPLPEIVPPDVQQIPPPGAGGGARPPGAGTQGPGATQAP